jgi:cysteine desulfurase
MVSSAAQRPTYQIASLNAGADDLQRIHLDANANAPPTSAVKAAVLHGLETGANPSSAHVGGDAARTMLAAARDAVAALCNGLFPEDVVFTSGCTEANNVVVASARAAGATLITSAVEHPSILRPAEAFEADGGTVIVVPVEPTGLLDLAKLEAALQSTAGPIFLSVQAANSETGVLQPIEMIAVMAAQRGDVLFHTDAAQAFGKSVLQIGGGHGPDAVSVSAHKLHGPMGVGALLLREGEARMRPLLLGGDQERGLRAGTQPLPLIAGFGAACAGRHRNLIADTTRMHSLRNRLETGICAALPTVLVNGAAAPRLPNTTNLQFPGVDAMALIALLDADGVLASQGSACHSRRPEPSPVLLAMGLQEDEAFASVRFSMSPLNTEAEIDAAIPIVVDACRRLGIHP